MINGESGNGYVAMNKYGDNNDPFHRNHGAIEGNKGLSNLYFYSMQNGMMMFSENCRGFQKIMIVYNGIMSNINEAPIVPQFFRQAVKDWVTVKALEIKLTDVVGTNAYGHWIGMLGRYENSLNKPYDGSWAKAEHRAKQMNAKERQDIKEYFTKLNY
jgi:CDGSH-type Zn-finger protein